jgi:TolB-like protein/Flp pilus assembly protein TadD
MSPDGDNEYFSDGLTEELLNILAKIKDLQVAGRTSSFAFKGQNEDLRSIGEKLGVKTILEGSVRKDQAGQKVRITAQLVNVENGFHLWSETYDRDLKDIFAIQDEIAHEVAAALKITLLGEDESRLVSHATTELNAYETYLQAMQQYNTFSYGGLREAESLYMRSIELDPEYTPAQMGLARTMFEMNFTGAMSRDEVTERASPILNDILTDDPKNAEARALFATTLGWQGDAEGRFRELEQALTDDPRNTRALEYMARTVFFEGESDTGIHYLEEAERLDPYSVRVLWSLCSLHGLRQDPESAIPYCDRIGEVEPNNPMADYGRANAALATGDLATSLVWNIKAIDKDPDDHELPAAVAALWLDLGDSEQAETWLEQADKISPDKTASVSSRILLMISREQNALAGDMARRALNSGLDRRVGTSGLIETMFLANSVSRGNIEEALEYYKSVRPEFFTDLDSLSRKSLAGTQTMIDIAYLMQLQNAESQHSRDLLEIAEQRLNSSDGKVIPATYSLFGARLAAVRGQHTQAMDLIETAVEQGWRANWRARLTIPPMFETMRNDPRFPVLVSKIEAEMEEQREKAYQLVEEFGP